MYFALREAEVEMKAAIATATHPASIPLGAEDITEFHASRILLLIYICGISGSVRGLTKLAKLDFFVRYPDFFERATAQLPSKPAASRPYRESSMLRYRYGPWDRRYYTILAFLESRELLSVERDRTTFIFTLSPTGRAISSALAAERSFSDLVVQMRAVKKAFGERSGDSLKKLIYHVFDAEITKLPLGARIS